MIENISLTDKSFDLNNIDNYHLSLQVYLKGFSFCILDRTRNKFIAIGNYQFRKITSYNVLIEEIARISENEPILNHNYQHIKLLFATPKYTFIPSVFYNKAEVGKIFQFNHNLKKTETLLENFIYGNSSYISYTIPSKIHSFFIEKYPNIRIYHQSCPHIEEILLKNKLAKTSTSVHINVYSDFFDIAIINKDKLELYNSFPYKSDADFQYFLLNVFDQTELSVSDIPIYISGVIRSNDNRIENLKQYIKNVSYLSKPNHFEYSFIFNEIPNHYFLNLINLYQCG